MSQSSFYRLYLLNAAGHIIASQEREAADDAAALQMARDLQHWQAVEVWNLARFVGKVLAPPMAPTVPRPGHDAGAP